MACILIMGGSHSEEAAIHAVLACSGQTAIIVTCETDGPTVPEYDYFPIKCRADLWEFPIELTRDRLAPPEDRTKQNHNTNPPQHVQAHRRLMSSRSGYRGVRALKRIRS